MVSIKDIDFIVSHPREMDSQESPIVEIEAAGYEVIEVEMRNLSCSSTQLQGIAVIPGGCGNLLLNPLPMRIGPLGVKKIRLLVQKQSGSSNGVVQLTRDGRVEFLSLFQNGK